MKQAIARKHYHPTESKYKGGADIMYITYELKQKTRGGNTALYPKVKRVYVPGEVQDWKVGIFTKRTGKKVRGVKIDYEKEREGYHRKPFAAHRGRTNYRVMPTDVEPTSTTFSHIVEVPSHAINVKFVKSRLPQKFSHALQRVR